MWAIKKVDKIKILKIILSILSIPIIVKIMYFINIIGVYFGSFLREISSCIG